MSQYAREFNHPFQPYDIQIEFMSNLYDCLDKGQVGIFESPTGTVSTRLWKENQLIFSSNDRQIADVSKGKSLSIICGALTWLRDLQATELAGCVEADDDDEPAWVIEHAKNERLQRALAAKAELEKRLARIRKKEQRQKRQFERGEPPYKRIKNDKTADVDEAADEEAFALADYDSETEKDSGLKNANDGLSSETLKLLEQAGMVLKSESPDEEALNVGTKIFYCSRTHSQLSQFANEVRRVTIPPAAVDPNDRNSNTGQLAESVKFLSLGSRKNLCINPRVAKLASATAINERCLELQQTKTPNNEKCPFVPTKETETLVHEFRDHALAEIRDIEDLGRIGKEVEICPYYASRATIKPSEIVTLPYPLLLQKTAREALGISLKDHVVIIDEAHNLMSAIEGIYSVSLTLNQLNDSRAQLTTYLQKFRNKLKGRNRVYVTQVVRLIDSLIAYLKANGTQANKGGVVDMTELLSGKGVDQINLHKLCHYLQESKLARKVAGYTTFNNEKESHASIVKTQSTHAKKSDPATPVLMLVESFFQALANPIDEGQFFHELDEQGSLRLKYMLLDPSEHFRGIVEDARAVILAGGTMSPMSDYMQHLFPYLPPGKTRTLSCGHVIPKENLLAAPLTQSNGVELDFTFAERGTPGVLNALGSTVLKLANTVPDGMVVFFPSYAYLEQVVAHWKKPKPNPGPPSTYEQLAATKTIFSESKDINVDQLFNSYAACIANTSSPGAILLAVVGGKLSEGINFSDALGRCVAVVGLPFPNAQSPEWRTKLEYIEKSALGRGQSAADGKALAREYYENACMRAVNQSIGRAIRHRGDWASIVLVDKRYAGPRIQRKLPGWIVSGMMGAKGGENEVWKGLGEFYKKRARSGS